MEIKQLMKDRAALVEEALAAYVNDTDPDFGVIYDAMRYSLMAGGKRLRPFLTLEFARLAAAESGLSDYTARERAMSFACALEMIHTYSLIHDDLPCMDNDVLRRGKPTSHVKFGEANALLAGDALLTRAFETAMSDDGTPADIRCKAVRLLAQCAGAAGMIGGQVLDLRGEKESFDFATLERLQSLKTGELIRCAALLGCYAGDGSQTLMAAAEEYAMGIGRAFQVIDDILDATGDEETLGKPIGSDAEQGKTTFLTFMTVDQAYAYAKERTDAACAAIRPFAGAEVLCELAEYLLIRRK
ncbi:MAG: polyprenyl synthetase family protein [Clostridia bacterium]|nr:polyprenyl synthetase family protein [Clostridia bacterium]